MDEYRAIDVCNASVCNQYAITKKYAQAVSAVRIDVYD